MPRLLLLRHAKSSWANPGMRDHDRPLNERGRAAAQRVGDFLRAEGLLPDLVLCSSARRVCETVARLDLPAATEIEVTHDLYGAAPDTVVDLIRDVDDRVDTLLVAGHNPTTHELALELTGEGDPDACQRLAEKYPTGALAILHLPATWAELGPRNARLHRFVVPRELE